MHFEIWNMMILINLSCDLSGAEVHFKVEENITPMKECDLIVVSQIRVGKGTV